MKNHDVERHPGPWRVMKIDSESAGLLIAAGFLVMGFVSMPVGAWFVLGSLMVGEVVALVLQVRAK